MIRIIAALACLAAPGLAHAETALAAVAANFAQTAQSLADAYEAETGDTISITTGSTGKLYAQIGSGAPYDLLLAADEETPLRLAADGHGVAVPYALGRLVLWVPGAEAGADGKAALEAARHVAIANPDLAPYGKAAMAAIEGMGLTAALKDRIVMGENVGQAFAMVRSGAADAGLVAASATIDGTAGLVWTVPPTLYPEIRQDAVLLTHGTGNAAAQGFIVYLTSEAAQAIIAKAGYGLPG